MIKKRKGTLAYVSLFMWQRFSAKARRSIILAQEVTVSAGGKMVGVAAMLYGLVQTEDPALLETMESTGIDSGRLRTDLRTAIQQEAKTIPGAILLTQDAKWVIDQAYRFARVAESRMIETTHIFMAISSDRKSPVHALLQGAGFDETRLDFPMVKRGRRLFGLLR